MRKWLIGAAAVAAMFGLSGCAAVLIGSAGAGGYYVGKDKRSASRIADDSAITTAVKSKLVASRDVKALDVNVDTYEGVVTLRGEVQTAGQRTAAQRIASASKGVKGVKNELRVR